MPRKSSFNPSIHSIYRLSRITAKATLQDVSKKMGITAGHLNNIEHGRRGMTEKMQERWHKGLESLKKGGV